MTRREAAYFDDRVTVQEEAHKVAVRAERISGLSGGVSIEDAYPRGAYVRLRITRGERTRIGRGIRRLRLVRVARSERALRRQQDRVSFEAAEKERIQIWSVAVEIDRNAVVIEYSSGRADAEGVMQRLFGPCLALRKIPGVHDACESPTGYELGADGATLTLHFATSGSAGDPRVQVTEFADRVSVAVIVPLPPIVTADLQRRTVAITLASPLTQRRVISTITRKPLPRNV